MARKNEQPISLKFLFFFTVFIIVFLVYATTPNEMKQIKKSKTFEEMLEYSNKAPVKKAEESYEQPKQTNKINSNQQKNKQVYKPQKTTYNVKETPKAEKASQEYHNLLDRMRKYPAKSVNSAENIVKDILKFKGYPEYTVKVISDEAKDMKQKTAGSYVAASFNISTGYMHINKAPLYALNIEEIIAIIAHELDHFEKISQVCKYMGTAEFAKMLNENKMQGLNYEFWNKAQLYANIDNFNGEYYKDALLRYISQGSIDLTSSYSDLYKLSEHIRNPLEISAYDISDSILEYYDIQIQEGPLRNLVAKFNSLDWAIYNLISQNKVIINERIAIFDYYFMNAIISSFPKYREIYNNCINNKNGDMTEFWLSFEKDHESFYNKNMQLDEKTYSDIINLVDKTEVLTKNGLTEESICIALKCKVNTLLSNIVFPNAIKYIKSAATDYLKHIKTNKISNPKDELQMILVLLCIENDLYANNPDPIPSLYYIKLPQDIEILYSISSKNKKFHFIYNNAEFQKILKDGKTENSALTEQVLLSQLLYETRLINKIK